MASKTKITVTRTALPPLKDYVKHLKKIWDRNVITNYGPLVADLESKLKKYLGAKNFFFVSNGTVALEIAIKALGIEGEIITTPFSYVATTSSIVWVGCKPVFVDIDPDTLNIDARLIEKAVTGNTKAILATHVYGNPCNIGEIQKIADKYNLKIIYDAAHCFGVKYKGKSLLNYGDVSTISFHATKLFHTAEGGGVVTSDDTVAHKCSYLRNFGHNGQEDFWGLGINGKNSELHAALGLTLLPGIKKYISKRKQHSGLYDRLLSFERLRKPVLTPHTEYNFAYYPVIFNSEKLLVKTRDKLNQNGIFPRRYFYPSLNTLNYVPAAAMPVTDDITARVLCLPLYNTLKPAEIKKISKIINNCTG